MIAVDDKCLRINPFLFFFSLSAAVYGTSQSISTQHAKQDQTDGLRHRGDSASSSTFRCLLLLWPLPRQSAFTSWVRRCDVLIVDPYRRFVTASEYCAYQHPNSLVAGIPTASVVLALGPVGAHYCRIQSAHLQDNKCLKNERHL